MNFKEWKETIFSLDRYENGEDAKKFSTLIADKPSDATEKQYIECLLETFSDQDDYGVQEGVLTVLDSVNQRIFFETLGENFQNLLESTKEKEWGLLILGRVINSNNNININELISVSKKCKNKTMLELLKSEYFQDEYPEISVFLK